MIQKRKFLIAIFTFLLTSLSFSQSVLTKIEISNEDIKLEVGDTVSISIIYFNQDDEVDTTGAVSSITPDSLGTFLANNNFVAENSGKGWIFASIDSLADSVEVEIEAVEKEDPEYPKLSILPEEIEVSVSDTISFSAYLEESDSIKTEVEVIWESLNPELFSINEEGILVALAVGEGKIKAMYDSLSVEADVNVVAQDDQPSIKNAALCVTPADTMVSIGTMINYSAFYKDEEDNPAEPVTESLEWTIEGMPIGDISSDGIFTATDYGFAVIKAAIDDSTFGTAFVIVEGDTSDTETNTILITKSSKNKKGYSQVKRLKEGERWVIGGMASPMNMLNGGFLYFPKGSLHEDIRIHVEMPKFAKVEGDSVSFGKKKKILNGVSFHVMVNDTIVEPYYFDMPIIASFVYKHGLLKKYNMEPQDLSIFFANTMADSVDLSEDGIENIIVDAAKNRIYGSIAHFSSLVVADKQSSITELSNTATIANTYELAQNYPNPFNPTTTISFKLANASNTTLNVYNSLGQKVETLVNRKLASGSHSFVWNAKNLPSGIYFYRLKADSFVETRKMILLK